MKGKKDILISAQNLTKEFCVEDNCQTIFENLSLDIYKGDFTVIMGASGAGKSTLMYSLIRFISIPTFRNLMQKLFAPLLVESMYMLPKR